MVLYISDSVIPVERWLINHHPNISSSHASDHMLFAISIGYRGKDFFVNLELLTKKIEQYEYITLLYKFYYIDPFFVKMDSKRPLTNNDAPEFLNLLNTLALIGLVPNFFRILEEMFERFEKDIRSIETHAMDILKMMKLAIDHQRATPLIVVDVKKEICNIFAKLIKKDVKHAIRKLNSLYKFTDDDIMAMFPYKYSDYDTGDFIRFGDPDSIDIDIAVFVKPSDVKNGIPKELSNPALIKLRDDLIELGYSEDKKLDINLICVDSKTGKIIASSKGGGGTANIIMETWHLHQQRMGETGIPLALERYPLTRTPYSEEMVNEKNIAIATFIYTYAQYLFSDYQQRFRKSPIRTTLHTDVVARINFVMNGLMDWIIYDPAELNGSGLCVTTWHDHYKSIIMKLIQLALIWKFGKSYYVKRDLANSLRELFPEHMTLESLVSCARWYLLRGTEGEFCEELFPLLIDQYTVIVHQLRAEQKVKVLTFPCEQILSQHPGIIPELSSDLTRMFFDSPVIYTQEFERQWTTLYGNQLINTQFILAATDEKEFYRQLQNIPEPILCALRRHLIFVDQRSPEWLRMYREFTCGSTSGEINMSTFQGIYNLIRGAILEILARELIDPESLGFAGFQKLSVGFIVEESILGAPAFAPDLLLWRSDENTDKICMIPVEIKGLKTLLNGSAYIRGLSLAQKQLHRAKELLGPHIEVPRGIILLCCVENNVLTMEVHTVNF